MVELYSMYSLHVCRVASSSNRSNNGYGKPEMSELPC